MSDFPTFDELVKLATPRLTHGVMHEHQQNDAWVVHRITLMAQPSHRG